MCDDFTAIAEDEALGRKGLTRRTFTAMGAAMGAAAALGGCARLGSDLEEDTVRIITRDGLADAFFVHPTVGAHPGIVMWPDIAGLRETFKVMARDLAAEGYAVLVVNPYYRGGPAPLLSSFSEWRTAEGEAKLRPLIAQLTPDAIARDGAAFVAFLDGSEAADKARGIGTCGYCMGGPFTVRTAAAVPGRVGAAASLHGARLVTGAPDSPHLLLKDTKASFLFAIARNDDRRDPEAKVELRKAAEAAHRPARIEVYPADHGWCVPDTPTYDPAQADRASTRMRALFAKL